MIRSPQPSHLVAEPPSEDLGRDLDFTILVCVLPDVDESVWRDSELLGAVVISCCQMLSEGVLKVYELLFRAILLSCPILRHYQVEL